MTDTKHTGAALLPVYLINGEDALKRDTVMKRLRERLSKMGDLSFNSDVFEGTEFTGDDVVNACNTIPFASDVRLVEVRGADDLKKADSEPIVAYLDAPCESTVLALVAEKLAKNTRLYKAVAKHGKTAVIDCAPPKARDLPKLVRSMAVGHGVTFSEGAAATLVSLVGEDTVHLDAETKKIALAHTGAAAVGEQEVLQLVSRTAEAKPWDFVNAFAARDTARCLLLLQRMRSVSPHALIPMCTARLRELICAKSMAARGNTTPRALAAALTDYAKIANAKARPKQDWQVKDHVSCARRFTADELRAALISARNTEQAMKSGADPDAAFREWVVGVTAKRR